MTKKTITSRDNPGRVRSWSGRQSSYTYIYIYIYMDGEGEGEDVEDEELRDLDC